MSFPRAGLSRVSMIALVAAVAVNVGLLFKEPAPLPESTVPARERIATDEDRRLLLISELDESKRREMANTQPRKAELMLTPEASTEAPALVCRAFGPFANPAQLESIRTRVEKAGEVVEVRQTEIEGAPDYLVYLESDNNLDNARRLLKELESQSIEAYVIAGGDFVDSVSAGVFSSEARADRQVQILVDLGYSPRVEKLTRMQSVHHLIALVPGEFSIDDQPMEDCPVVASAG